MRRRLSSILLMVALVWAFPATGCSGKSAGPPVSPPDACKQSDGPTADTVRQSIASVPVVVPGSSWVEIARGHTRNCRLYWVQIIPTIADQSTPQQLLFFDRNTALGSPTPNAKPYIRVLPPGQGTVTVEYQWRVGSDPECCPTGSGAVRFQIGPDGRLKALGPIPHQ